MAGVYNQAITKANVGSEVLVPVEDVNSIIQDAPKSSVVLSRAMRATMSTAKRRQPVLSTLPVAYWVNGDTGLKQTSEQLWTDTYITAEEMAVIVPVSQALLDDASIDIWSEVRPRIAEAMGKKVDQAAIFGTDIPASWGDSIMTRITAAHNTVTKGTGVDLGVDVASMAQKVAEEGYAINGFASKPGLNWQLVGLRSTTGTPIYTPMVGEAASGLYGYPLNETVNGAWDATKAIIIGADWTKFVCGIRRDMTYQVFDQGVITDDAGAVIVNLMQQDMVALRVTFRVGFACAVPKTQLGTSTSFPAGAVIPAAGATRSAKATKVEA